MKSKDASVIRSALDCRANLRDKGMDLPDFDGNDPNVEKYAFCDKCPYYYDDGGCDLKQLLDDAEALIGELTRSKYCYQCVHYDNPDDCCHWLPCQAIKIDPLWHCADYKCKHETK